MRYPGGKGRCFHKLVSMMPPHRVYMETHLGGGAVFRHKTPAEFNIGIDLDPAVIAMWGGIDAGRLDLRLGDAADFLRRYHFVGDELVYCDPPYLRETRRGRRIYRFEYTTCQHGELLRVLRTLPCAVMVSGYRSEFYDELLEGWLAVEFPSDTQAGPSTEVVWKNFGSPEVLHDYSHIGADFREREGIRRRRTALARRIDALPAMERRALFRSLADRHGMDIESALVGRPR